MRQLFSAACLAGLALAGAAHAQTAPLMSVAVKAGPMNPDKGGDADVVMTLPDFQGEAGKPLFSLPGAGQAMARPPKITGVSARDAGGDIPLTEGRGGWTPSRAVSGELTIRYRMFVENIPILSGSPPTMLRIDGDGFSGTGSSLLASVKTDKPYRLSVKWDVAGMGAGAETVSSFGDGDIDLPAGPVSRIGRSFFMAGHVQRDPQKDASGAFSSVWLGDPGFDAHAAMQWTSKLHAAMSRFFHDEAEPPYRVFLRFNPMNAGGGAAFYNSFVVTYGKGVNGESLKSILGHEMTHTWTALGMPKWYSEGNAVYYQALIAWRAGLIDTDHYLADLNETASRYYTNALYNVPEDQVTPRFWEDTRIRVLPYDRGAMYFAVLNGKIRKASGGKRSVDDLILEMNGRAKAGQSVNEAVWLDLLRKEIGEAGPEVHRNMMAGGWVLPASDDFGPCFRRVTKKIRRFDFGFDPKSVVGADHVIQGLKPGSEAEKAGLKNGDHVTYGVATDALQGDVKALFDLQVTRDGKTFPLSYLPRGEAIDTWQWERIPGVPESACKV